MSRFSAGSSIRFTYSHSYVDQHTGDRFKEVFVLNPDWKGKVHGIDLKRLTTAEREVLRAIMDPETVKGRHKVPLVNDVLRRMDPIEIIKNPMSFYQRFVRLFLRRKDAYRTYFVNRIINATVTQQTSVRGKTFNPKPLFKKSETKPKAPTPTKGSRLDAIKTAHHKALVTKAAEKLMKDRPSEVPTPDRKVNRMDLIKAAAAKRAAKASKGVPSPDSKVNRIDMIRAAANKAKAQAKAERVYDDDHVEKKEKDDQYSNRKPKVERDKKIQRAEEEAKIAAFLAKKRAED